MDVEKLIERLKNYSIKDKALLNLQTVKDAAEALAALQAENERLKSENVMHKSAADDYYNTSEEYRRERNDLLEELEKVKAERDAAVECIPHECKTCVYHTVFFNGCTPDHDCTNPDGGCSNNYDRWEWRGPQKEE